MIIPFQHHPLAHCESGVTSSLLKHYGLPVSEPMAFGIGSGLFFGHLPFVKVNGVPGTTYRIYPGQIFRNVCKRLDIRSAGKRFGSVEEGMRALNENIDKGIPTGCQVSVFYLPFLPEVFRFHFNAHNLIVHGYEERNYFVSDPVMETLTEIRYEDLAKARFAKGVPEPKGRMYFIEKVPKEIDLKTAALKGIRQTCFFMSSPPLPWFGVNAIKFLSEKIRQYPVKLEPRKAKLYLGNVIRMQEEIGTGGAGFRFLYAAFLQETCFLNGNTSLREFSERMTAIGDQWRNFAFESARLFKARDDKSGYDQLADLLLEIYQQEKVFFKDLKKAV